MTRALTLRRDVLAPLSDDDLAAVVAGTESQPTSTVFEYVASRIGPCTV